MRKDFETYINQIPAVAKAAHLEETFWLIRLIGTLRPYRRQTSRMRRTVCSVSPRIWKRSSLN